MTEQTQTETPAAGAEKPMETNAAKVDSIDTRAAELIEKLTNDRQAELVAEAEAEIAGDHGTTPEADVVDASAEKPKRERGTDGKFKPKAKDEGAPVADERAEKIARAAALEREAQQGKKRMLDERRQLDAAKQQLESERAALEKIKAETAAMQKRLSGEDPLALLQTLSEKVPPEMLGDFLVQARDPAKRAEWAAKQAAAEASAKVSPEVQAMRAELDALKEHLQTTNQSFEMKRAQQIFIDAAKELAEEAPHVSALLEKRPENVLRHADDIATHLAATDPDWESDSVSTRMAKVVRSVESGLSDFASIFAPQSGGEQKPSPKVNGSAPVHKARTLTARTSSGRSLISEDESEAYAKLSVDERAELLKKKARTFRDE